MKRRKLHKHLENTEGSIALTIAEVITVIKKVKPSKATDPNGISDLMLKHIKPVGINYQTSLLYQLQISEIGKVATVKTRKTCRLSSILYVHFISIGCQTSLESFLVQRLLIEGGATPTWVLQMSQPKNCLRPQSVL